MKSSGWALVQYDWYPYTKRKSEYRQVQREGHMKTQGDDHHAGKRETSEEINPTLTSHLQPPEL